MKCYVSMWFFKCYVGFTLNKLNLVIDFIYLLFLYLQSNNQLIRQ